jgi:hypothetical protein
LQEHSTFINTYAVSPWPSSVRKFEISDFELSQPDIDDNDLGKKISFVDWLENALGEGKRAPTFCFPSTTAGPDLTFILDRTSG